MTFRNILAYFIINLIFAVDKISDLKMIIYHVILALLFILLAVYNDVNKKYILLTLLFMSEIYCIILFIIAEKFSKLWTRLFLLSDNIYADKQPKTI